MDIISMNVSRSLQRTLRIAYVEARLGNLTFINDDGKPLWWQTWCIGLGLVSACSYAAPLGIMILPCLKPALYERMMTFLIALGIGALSGSTMFIMIPQAFNLPLLDEFYYRQKASFILGALYMFFTVDRVLQYILQFRRIRQAKRRVHASTLEALVVPKIQITSDTNETVSTDSTNKSINVERSQESLEMEDREKADIAEDLEIAMLNNDIVRRFSSRRRLAVVTAVDEMSIAGTSGTGLGKEVVHLEGSQLSVVHSELRRSLSRRRSRESMQEAIQSLPRTSSTGEVSVSISIIDKRVIESSAIEVASVAYMIIFGSSANNFVDGMSMGAAFSKNLVRGLSIGIAALSQQFPQELGTLAILVKSGLGVRRTLLFNLIPIVLSYIGFVLGVILENVDQGYDDYIFSISSGMYLYIFLGTLIPEIRDSANELIKCDLRESVLVNFLQAVGISSGIVFMYYMSAIGQ